MVKTAIFRPGFFAKSLKLNIDSHIQGNSDQLLLVKVQILLSFEEISVQNSH